MSIEDEIARILRENVGRAIPAPDVATGDPPSRRLPRLRGVPGIYIEDENTALFILEDEVGEKVHLPIDGQSLALMADLIRYVLQVGLERSDEREAKPTSIDLVVTRKAAGW